MARAALAWFERTASDGPTMGKNLFEKVWDAHTVRTLPDGRSQLFIGLHLIHEVTTPQAFGMLRDLGLKVAHPERTFATVDHIIPTDTRLRPFKDDVAEQMTVALSESCTQFGIQYFAAGSGRQGIVHVVGPELGLTQPGMTICCGDSHTSTHGALGAVAFGIGTSQVRDVLATQTLAMARLAVRRIEIEGRLGAGVYAKDVILHVIRQLGVNGGAGFAYEYAGSTISAMSMEERMTLCNMSIEGGARVGYVNPDETTYAYLQGRPFAPSLAAWPNARAYFEAVRSDDDARYEDVVKIDARAIAPSLAWGINPGQVVTIDERLPEPSTLPHTERASVSDALDYMKFTAGQPIKGQRIDVAFIGSCTNGRLSDLREVARYVRGKRVAPHVKALIVPGSELVQKQAEDEGLADAFKDAGFEWRHAGCSMCLGMNPDKLRGDQLCASSSNRNFKGRMGSPTGRTLLMSPLMVAAAAVAGEVADARDVFGIEE
jgi:3-isopropylmalate/(R)-2-methylmalate dehydratase large subunit